MPTLALRGVGLTYPPPKQKKDNFLPSFTALYQVFTGMTRFDWTLPSFIVFHCVSVWFTEFDWNVQGLNGFDWVLLSFTGFYWVSHVFVAATAHPNNLGLGR